MVFWPYSCFWWLLQKWHKPNHPAELFVVCHIPDPGITRRRANANAVSNEQGRRNSTWTVRSRGAVLLTFQWYQNETVLTTTLPQVWSSRMLISFSHRHYLSLHTAVRVHTRKPNMYYIRPDGSCDWRGRIFCAGKFPDWRCENTAVVFRPHRGTH